MFDVDGVLIDSPHEHAWRDALEQLMETRWSAIRDETTYSPERFTPEVYRAHMSGKTTFAGARAALDYFGVPGDDARTEEYGRRKQRVRPANEWVVTRIERLRIVSDDLWSSARFAAR